MYIIQEFMKTNIEKELFNLEDKNFTEEYFELLINRFTHSSMALELDLGNIDSDKNAIKLNDYMISFKHLLELLPTSMEVDEELITSIANKVNEHSMYISNGYRKSGDFLAETKIPISKPENIQKDINELLKKYNEDWKDLDPFEREAKFHIAFIRIHPFEDGNGRTSRLILNYNLLRQKQAPVIITDDLTDYYYSFIANYDEENMARIFKIQSTKEHSIIHQLLDIRKEQDLIEEQHISIR